MTLNEDDGGSKMTCEKSPSPASAFDRAAVAPALLEWYDRHHRDLPWRTTPAAAKAGARPDPYHVWLSEVMLQQTTVEAVKPYFRAFLARWPDVASLAAAPVDDVMRAWAGLGYYSRARNLKRCAEAVAALPGGAFPRDEETLRTLPGIGGYTAAAIAAIAFDGQAAVVDGNVERVTCRLFAIETPMPAARPEIRRHVEAMTPARRPGDFAQAMMDLGATICTPRRPACVLCPLREACMGLVAGNPERLPVKAAKKRKPLRKGAAFVAVRGDGAVLLRKRADKGLLGGMSEVPTSDWTARQDGEESVSAAPFAADWRRTGTIAHVFTHFALELAVYRADDVRIGAPADHWWSGADMIAGEALPTVMKKVVESAIPGTTKKQPGTRPS